MVEPGIGFEPMWSRSAADRLNRSATPALMQHHSYHGHLKKTSLCFLGRAEGVCS